MSLLSRIIRRDTVRLRSTSLIALTCAAVFASLLPMGAPPTRADSHIFTYTPTKDATITRDDYSDSRWQIRGDKDSVNSNDNSSELKVRFSDIAGIQNRALLQFDLSNLSKDKPVHRAELELQWKTGSALGLPMIWQDPPKMYAYALTRSNWGEGQVTWNRYRDSDRWTKQGGDFDQELVSSRVWLDTACYTHSECTARFDVKTLVEHALTRNNSNLDIIIMMDEKKDMGDFVFHSSESSSAKVPQLTIALKTIESNCNVDVIFAVDDSGSMDDNGSHHTLRRLTQDLQRYFHKSEVPVDERGALFTFSYSPDQHSNRDHAHRSVHYGEGDSLISAFDRARRLWFRADHSKIELGLVAASDYAREKQSNGRRQFIFIAGDEQTTWRNGVPRSIQQRIERDRELGIMYYTFALRAEISPEPYKEIARLSGGKFYQGADFRGIIERHLSEDSCAVDAGQISGQKFYDRDADGTLDATEEGLAGFTVELYDESGATVGSVKTDNDGAFVFTGLQSGKKYRIAEVLSDEQKQALWQQTTPEDSLTTPAESSQRLIGNTKATTLQFCVYEAGSRSAISGARVYPDNTHDIIDETRSGDSRFAVTGNDGCSNPEYLDYAVLDARKFEGQSNYTYLATHDGYASRQASWSYSQQAGQRIDIYLVPTRVTLQFCTREKETQQPVAGARVTTVPQDIVFTNPDGAALRTGTDGCTNPRFIDYDRLGQLGDARHTARAQAANYAATEVSWQFENTPGQIVYLDLERAAVVSSVTKSPISLSLNESKAKVTISFKILGPDGAMLSDVAIGEKLADHHFVSLDRSSSNTANAQLVKVTSAGRENVSNRITVHDAHNVTVAVADSLAVTKPGEYYELAFDVSYSGPADGQVRPIDKEVAGDCVASANIQWANGCVAIDPGAIQKQTGESAKLIIDTDIWLGDISVPSNYSIGEKSLVLSGQDAGSGDLRVNQYNKPLTGQLAWNSLKSTLERRVERAESTGTAVAKTCDSLVDLDFTTHSTWYITGCDSVTLTDHGFRGTGTLIFQDVPQVTLRGSLRAQNAGSGDTLGIITSGTVTIADTAELTDVVVYSDDVIKLAEQIGDAPTRSLTHAAKFIANKIELPDSVRTSIRLQRSSQLGKNAPPLFQQFYVPLGGQDVP